MPELPEVESLRRSLEPVLIGSRINKVVVKRAKIVSSSGTTRQPNPSKVKEFESVLINQKIIGLNRRAKNIIIELESGNCLLVHLKMTGQLVFVGEDSGENSGENLAQNIDESWEVNDYAKEIKNFEITTFRNLTHSKNFVQGGHPIQESEINLPNKHTYIIWELDNGVLYYNDVRQFGYVLFYQSIEEIEATGHFEKLGLEPLDDEFDLDYFGQSLKNKKTVIKKLFLDQTVVVGLGNIYCDEVCFEAGVMPTRIANSLSSKEIAKVYNSIKKIIAKAIDEGGSSIANYLLADGSRGSYAKFHNVYGRKGKNCFICNSVLESCVIGARTTVFCTKCQK